MNSCNFVGKLIKDVELRYTESGKATASLTVAVYNPFARGEFKNDLVTIITWQKTAELCADKLSKGSLISVKARYSPRSYDNNEGKKVWVSEFTSDQIGFLDPRPAEPQKDPFVDDGKPVDISSDDLPW
jgi:single-strand DNA-binding protein